MKKIQLGIIIGTFIFISSSAFAQADYYIDSEILKYEKLRAEKLNQLHKEYGCKKEKGYGCFEKSSGEVNMIYPSRGRRYAEKNYANFNESQAYSKLAELAKLYEKLPVKVAGKPPLGVIKKSSIEAEAWFLVNKVLNVNGKRRSDIMLKMNTSTLKQPFVDKNLNTLTPLVK